MKKQYISLKGLSESEKKVVQSFHELIKSYIPKDDILKILNDLLTKEIKGYSFQINKLLVEQRKIMQDDAKFRKELLSEVKTTLRSVVTNHKKFKEQIASFEETLLFIMHNVKRNQFLYAHYPEDWVKSYSDLKEGLKSENLYMDHKLEMMGSKL